MEYSVDWAGLDLGIQRDKGIDVGIPSDIFGTAWVDKVKKRGSWTSSA